MNETATDAFTSVASGLYLEGLAIDHARDVIWYSDVIGGGVHGVKPDGTKVASLNPDRMWTGGVLMNADGAVLSSGRGGIMWNHPDTGRSGWLIDTIDGKPVNGINEMVPDGTGGIFFGTVDLDNIVQGKEARPTALYRLSADRELTRLADGLRFTNGLMFDAARRRLYCNATFDSTLLFDVADDFTLDNRRTFLEKTDCDGMALDEEGTVWITGVRSAFFERVQPDGSVLERYATPPGSVTQLRFGGADMRDIWFNLVPSDGGETLKEGGEISAVNSHLYRGRSPVAGARVEPARFYLG